MRRTWIEELAKNERVAREFPSQKSLNEYLREHPKADKSKHTVVETKGKGKDDDDGGDGKPKGENPGWGAAKPDDDDIATYDEVRAYEGKLPEYNLDILAGEDGKITKGDLRRALEVKRKVQEGIDKSADVCKVSPPVCKQNKGITRDNMPQVPEESVKQLLESSDPADKKKGEAAVAAGADPKDDTPMTKRLLDFLSKDKGIKITTGKKVPVGKLKATQAEIKAKKTMDFADWYFKGTAPNGKPFDPTKKPIIVSKDGYILDGHHRWSSMLTANPNAEMNVIEVGMDMEDMLTAAFEMPGVFRMDLQDNVIDNDKPLDLARKPGSTWQQKGKWYGKDKDGKAGGPYKDKDAAEAYAKGQKKDDAKAKAPAKKKVPAKVASFDVDEAKAALQGMRGFLAARGSVRALFNMDPVLVAPDTIGFMPARRPRFPQERETPPADLADALRQILPRINKELSDLGQRSWVSFRWQLPWQRFDSARVVGDRLVFNRRPAKVASAGYYKNEDFLDNADAEALFAHIRPRDKVTIVTPQGQLRTGVATLRGPAGQHWVLNMGGAHGTPGIVTPANIVKVNGKDYVQTVGKTASEDRELRKATIRLAHQRPELRPFLLPLLASTGKDGL